MHEEEDAQKFAQKFGKATAAKPRSRKVEANDDDFADAPAKKKSKPAPQKRKLAPEPDSSDEVNSRPAR